MGRHGFRGLLLGALLLLPATAGAAEDAAIRAWDAESGALLWSYESRALDDAWVELYPGVLVVHGSYRDAQGRTDVDVYLDSESGRVVAAPEELGVPLAESRSPGDVGVAGAVPIVHDGTVFELSNGPSSSPQGPPKPPDPGDDPTDKKGRDDDCDCRAVGAPSESAPSLVLLSLLALGAARARRRGLRSVG